MGADFVPPVEYHQGAVVRGYERWLGWMVSSVFGNREDPLAPGTIGGHGGWDLFFPNCKGAPVRAPRAGTLTCGWDFSGGGNWAQLLTKVDVWGFGHLDAFALGIGQHRVEAGDLIGWVGTTGRSTGPHLHLAWRRIGAGSWQDPRPVLEELAALAQTINEGDLTVTERQELMDRIGALESLLGVWMQQQTRLVVEAGDQDQAELLAALNTHFGFSHGLQMNVHRETGEWMQQQARNTVVLVVQAVNEAVATIVKATGADVPADTVKRAIDDALSVAAGYRPDFTTDPLGTIPEPETVDAWSVPVAAGEARAPRAATEMAAVVAREVAA